MHRAPPRAVRGYAAPICSKQQPYRRPHRHVSGSAAADWRTRTQRMAQYFFCTGGRRPNSLIYRYRRWTAASPEYVRIPSKYISSAVLLFIDRTDRDPLPCRRCNSVHLQSPIARRSLRQTIRSRFAGSRRAVHLITPTCPPGTTGVPPIRSRSIFLLRRLLGRSWDTMVPTDLGQFRQRPGGAPGGAAR